MESESDPVTVDALADLQAGRLDDETAARLRRRARAEPETAARLAALDRVRRELADLGADRASAPDLPAHVTARIGAALRAAPSPAPAPRRGARRVAAAAGVAAVVTAGAVGTIMLVRPGAGETPRTEPAAAQPRGGLPLADDDVVVLLDRPADFGALGDPQRLASCLSGLGYPTSTRVLGARPLDVDGRPGLLLLLPGDVPRQINAVVVAPGCSAVDTGLLATRVVAHS
ncbi:MAG: hypothetical protein QOJ95_5775 [Mycobacterium sp.]|nr:hypothetical protein [Mycobacterium sp.]